MQKLRANWNVAELEAITTKSGTSLEGIDPERAAKTELSSRKSRSPSAASDSGMRLEGDDKGMETRE